MLQTLKRKKDEVVDSLRNIGEKGFTLTELLMVLALIGIIALIVMNVIPDFNKAEGTKVQKHGSDVESAIAQATISNQDRLYPALAEAGSVGGDEADGEIETPNGTVESVTITLESDDFDNENQAAEVIEAVGHQHGLTGSGVMGLMREVEIDQIQDKVPGVIDLEDQKYYIIAPKSQLYDGAAIDAYDGYNDTLAGRVFSKATVVDGDEMHYNGSHAVNIEQFEDGAVNGTKFDSFSASDSKDDITYEETTSTP